MTAIKLKSNSFTKSGNYAQCFAVSTLLNNLLFANAFIVSIKRLPSALDTLAAMKTYNSLQDLYYDYL